ncbi:MAG: primosomal protein N' (replication factor Y) - superfamily II helicase [Pseudomonadota bacterium]
MADIPCGECGAQLAYNPGAGTLVCPYCGSTNTLPDDDTAAERPADGPWGGVATAEVEEQDYESALAELMRADRGESVPIEVMRTVRCQTCGAEVGLDDPAAAGTAQHETTIADDCPFCAAPLTNEDARDHRHPRPIGVLPFALDQRGAKQAMKQWIASRWFAPNDLKAFAEAGRPMKGVYVPHYTYDAAVKTRYQGKRGVEYTVKRGKETVRRVRWYSASGTVHHFFDDVLVPASATLTEFAPEASVRGGANWDLQGMQPYRKDFLAGFRAEAPSLSLEHGFARARGACEDHMRHLVRRDIGGDRQRITHMQSEYTRVTFKHVLLPVWLAAYRYNNKPYRVAVNGRTGQTRGERPYSAIKIALAALAALLIIAAIAWAQANGYLGSG